MKRLILGCCLLLAACGRPDPEAIDGDTFTRGSETIRLWGIDAPELEQTCLDEGWRRYNCGQLAKNALSFLLKQGSMFCQTYYTDHHGRTVALCRYTGTSVDIAERMVSQGLALDYPRYSKGYYTYYENMAREKRRGIHDGYFIAPEEYRIKYGQTR